HAEQFGDNAGLGRVDSGLAVAFDPAPVVGVLRGQALQVGGALGELDRGVGDGHLGGVGLRGVRLRRGGTIARPGRLPHLTGVGIDLALVDEADRLLGVPSVRVRHFFSVSTGSSTTSASTTWSSSAVAEAPLPDAAASAADDS